MRLPVIQGVIRRRILVNFRVAPEVMQAQLPSRFPEGTVAFDCALAMRDIRHEWHTAEDL